MHETGKLRRVDQSNQQVASLPQNRDSRTLGTASQVRWFLINGACHTQPGVV